MTRVVAGHQPALQPRRVRRQRRSRPCRASSSAQRRRSPEQRRAGGRQSCARHGLQHAGILLRRPWRLVVGEPRQSLLARRPSGPERSRRSSLLSSFARACVRVCVCVCVTAAAPPIYLPLLVGDARVEYSRPSLLAGHKLDDLVHQQQKESHQERRRQSRGCRTRGCCASCALCPRQRGRRRATARSSSTLRPPPVGRMASAARAVLLLTPASAAWRRRQGLHGARAAGDCTRRRREATGVRCRSKRRPSGFHVDASARFAEASKPSGRAPRSQRLRPVVFRDGALLAGIARGQAERRLLLALASALAGAPTAAGRGAISPEGLFRSASEAERCRTRPSS